jgi:hypothetical protein
VVESKVPPRSPELNPYQVQKLKNTVFETPPEKFDEFKKQFFNKWEVTLPINKEE